MTDLLDRLVARARGSEAFVQPRIASLYEPVRRPDLEEIWVEEGVGPRPSVPVRSVRPGAPVTERSTGLRDGGTEATVTGIRPDDTDVAASAQPEAFDSGEAPEPTAISLSLDASDFTGRRTAETGTLATALRSPTRDPQVIPAAPSKPPPPFAAEDTIAPTKDAETAGDDPGHDAPRPASVSPSHLVAPPAVGTMTILAQRRMGHTRPPQRGGDTKPTSPRRTAVAHDVDQPAGEAQSIGFPPAVGAPPTSNASPQPSAGAVPVAPTRPVRITIGRIEVRANPPKPPEARGDPAAGTSSLDGYLDRWSRGA